MVSARLLTGAPGLKLDEKNNTAVWRHQQQHTLHCIVGARQQEQLIWNWKPTEQFVDINPHITLIMGNKLQVWNWTVWRHQQTFKLVSNDTVSVWRYLVLLQQYVYVGPTFSPFGNIFGNVCIMRDQHLVHLAIYLAMCVLCGNNRL